MQLNEQAIADTVADVEAAILSIGDNEIRGLTPSGYPVGQCEFAAIAIAGVLEDRDLGSWLYVLAAKEGESSGHAWLEYQENGVTLYSVDPTLGQFEMEPRHDLGEPRPMRLPGYVGPGRSPAIRRYPHIVQTAHPTELPWAHDRSSYARLRERVRDILGSG